MFGRFSPTLTNVTCRSVNFNSPRSFLSTCIPNQSMMRSSPSQSFHTQRFTSHHKRYFSTKSTSQSESEAILSEVKEAAPTKRATRGRKKSASAEDETPAPEVAATNGEVASTTTKKTRKKKEPAAPKQLGDDANQLLKDIHNMTEKPKKSKALLESERSLPKPVTFKTPTTTTDHATIMQRGDEITERYIIVGVDKCRNIDYIHSSLNQLEKKYGDINYPISTSYYSSIQYDTRRNEILALLREPTHRLKTSPIVFLTQTRFITPRIMKSFSDRPLVPYRYVGNHINFIEHLEKRLKDPSMNVAEALYRPLRQTYRELRSKQKRPATTAEAKKEEKPRTRKKESDDNAKTPAKADTKQSKSDGEQETPK